MPTEHGPVEDEVRAANLWRATGLGLAMVWGVVLLLVIGYAVQLTFDPGDGDPPGAVRLLLVPLALVAVALFVWVAVAGWRIQHRRPSGWDPVVVVGGLALASGIFVAVPWRFDGGPGKGLTPMTAALIGLGLLSVVAGLVGQRSWLRAAEALEESHAGGAFPGAGDDGLG
jgi:drug/metabolite transporter (DMT)-like permease